MGNVWITRSIGGLTLLLTVSPAIASPPTRSPILGKFKHSSSKLTRISSASNLTKESFYVQLPLPSQPTVPPEQLPPEPEPLPDDPLPPLEDLLRSPSIPSPETPQPQDIPGTITVERFEVTGSTVFSQEEFEELLKDYTERPITFAQLLEIQDKITELYQQFGYITSGAFIPADQRIVNGVVRVEVIEGEVEEINIAGLERLNPGYIRSRIGVAIQPPLDREKLLNALQLLQLDPLIENLNVELSAGSRPGRSILDVRVQEANPIDFAVVLDNQRSPSVGSFRRKAQFSHGNLLGIGDRFDFSFVNTDGSNAIENLAYTVPVNPYNGTLSFAYRRSRSDIIEDPFNALDIESLGTGYELTVRQPLKQSPTEDLALGLSLSRQESRTFIGFADIGPFPLSPGSDERGETKISALRFFQEYTQRSSEDVFAVRSQLSLGTNWFNATENETPPDSDFFHWRGQGQYLRLLAPDTLLLLRSDIQLGDRPLLPTEQFSAGGALSVRGYRQDLLLADNGFFASAEVRFPILRISEWDSLVQIAPFFDLATLWNFSDNPTALEVPTIYSAGVGLLWRVGRNFNARLDYGIPLVDVSSSRRTWQENGIYFSVEFRL
ncbi:MAG: ShlB/FhaC/HecB family hemolysin secretion/activation protein [Cyanobacteriota bacterium]|nr:ShlB/FhaC/HecB family hemolysin secretion/activation protein [Cyanobacteriota bacterium]